MGLKVDLIHDGVKDKVAFNLLPMKAAKNKS
jgi:hypothetical protein